MFNKEQLDNILNTPVSRRQFLTHIGAAIVSMIGLTTFLNNLDKFSHNKTSDGGGYGWSAYSGVPPQRSHITNSMNKMIGKI